MAVRARALLTLALTLPSAASAQITSAPEPLCFEGGRKARCSSFLLTEMHLVAPIGEDQSSTRDWRGDEFGAADVFERHLEWEIGVLHNATEEWAFGGTVGIRTAPDMLRTMFKGMEDPLGSVSVRARRWLGEDVGLDLSVGRFQSPAPREWDQFPRERKEVHGVRGDARVVFSDDVSLGLRVERVPFDPYRPERAGPQHAVSVLAGLGSGWAAAGSVSFGILMLVGTVVVAAALAGGT